MTLKKNETYINEITMYTSIEQSKRLLELGLNPKTADMSYRDYQWKFNDDGSLKENSLRPMDTKPWVGNEWNDYPCWSLGALLELMPELPGVEYDLVHRQEEYYMAFDDLNMQIHDDFLGKSPLEAAYNMVVWLLENNYIH